MTEIFTVKKMEQAKKMASETFGVSEDLIVFRVIEEKKGFFGKMKVEAIYEAPADSAETKNVQTPAPASPAPAPIEQAPASVAEESAPAETETEIETKTETIGCAPESEDVQEEIPAPDSLTSHADEEQAVLLDIASLPEHLAAARQYIMDIYAKMGVTVEVSVAEIENGILMNVTSDNKSGTIIGRRGETLDSIQYLASIIANRGKETYSRIMLDSNGYRTKRRKTLEQLAEKIAKNVLRSGRATTLEPMNPYERRIIHSKISEIEGVVSHSVGEDPYRKVVVAAVAGVHNKKTRGKSGNGKGGKKPYREKRPEDFKPSNLDNMKTSFEKDYKKPRPEDEIHTGLYGKIEL